MITVTKAVDLFSISLTENALKKISMISSGMGDMLKTVIKGVHIRIKRMSLEIVKVPFIRQI